jgi:hypothetical protein
MVISDIASSVASSSAIAEVGTIQNVSKIAKKTLIRFCLRLHFCVFKRIAHTCLTHCLINQPFEQACFLQNAPKNKSFKTKA